MTLPLGKTSVAQPGQSDGNRLNRRPGKPRATVAYEIDAPAV